MRALIVIKIKHAQTLTKAMDLKCAKKLIMNNKLFPTIIIILMACASAVYLYHGEIKTSVFWLALAVANACVVY